MQITFIRDVTLPGESGGPHYVRGYAPDVSDAEARKWIASGDAVAGVVTLQAEQPKAESVEIPAFRKARRFRASE